MGHADGCYELAMAHGWERVVSLRLGRLWRMLFAQFAKTNRTLVFGNADITEHIAAFLWFA